jgi:hypothetical protein
MDLGFSQVTTRSSHSCYLAQCIKSKPKTHLTLGHTRSLQIFTRLSITDSHTIQYCKYYKRRSQLPRGLRRGTVADNLLGFRVQTPPEAWNFVSCKWCVYWEVQPPASG